MHTNYPRIANKIIEWGIIFLIVFTPIAFGTVHPWAYTIMELTVCIMVIVWIVRLAMININKTTIFPSHQSPTSQNRQGRYSDHQSTIKSSNDNRHSTINKSSISNHQSAIINQQSILVNRFGFIKTPLTIPIILFVGLILFQLTPLPPGVLKILSPNTYKLYETTIPDWQPSAKNHELSTMSDRHSPSLSSSQSAISHQPVKAGNQSVYTIMLPKPNSLRFWLMLGYSFLS